MTACVILKSEEGASGNAFRLYARLAPTFRLPGSRSSELIECSYGHNAQPLTAFALADCDDRSNVKLCAHHSAIHRSIFLLRRRAINAKTAMQPNMTQAAASIK